MSRNDVIGLYIRSVAAEKAPLPTVEWLIGGTTRRLVPAEWGAHRPGTSVFVAAVFCTEPRMSLQNRHHAVLHPPAVVVHGMGNDAVVQF